MNSNFALRACFDRNLHTPRLALCPLISSFFISGQEGLQLVVAFLQNNVTVVELLANDENSNFICQWSVKSSWMFHGWSSVWSNNYTVLW